MTAVGSTGKVYCRGPEPSVDHVDGYGHFVVLKAREDLFKDTGEEIIADDGTVLPGIQIAQNNSVTSIPDNIGCCEIVSVGRDVHNVSPGDIVFIDFFDVAQGCLLGGLDEENDKITSEERYIAPDHAFRAKYDPVTGTVEPLPGYCTTKRVPFRFKVALTGTDRVEVLDYLLSEGIPGGKTSNGSTVGLVVYQEIVSVGPVLPDDESYTPRERMLLARLRELEGAAPIEPDIRPGDLAVYCTEFATKIRVRGEFMHIVPYSNLLGSIDDAAILCRAIRAGKAGKILLAG